MSERLTDAELAEIEARCEAATEGPWAYDNRGDKCSDVQVGIAADKWGIQHNGYIPDAVEGTIYIGGIATIFSGNDMADGAFIAHSRTDVPRLLAALRAERTRNAALVAWVRKRGYDTTLRSPLGEPYVRCNECGHCWQEDEPEQHKSGCELAALLEVQG
jgi:hypothetical protein